RTVGSGPWIELDDHWGTEPDGARSPDGRVLGTTLHGLFDSDGFRSAFLAEVAGRRGKPFIPSGVSFAAAREAQLDRLADLVEAHLDTAGLEALIKEGGGT
ncbi:MAG: cobyric acid synthase, partial [Acidimicrobiia bacterium]